MSLMRTSPPSPVYPRAAWTSAAALLLLASAAWGQTTPSFDAADSLFAPQTFETSLDKAVAPGDAKPARLTAARRAGVDLGNLSALHLAAVDRDKLFREDAQAPLPGLTKMLRIGV